MRTKPHECDCEFCSVTEVPMTPEDIAQEENHRALREERELWVHTPAITAHEQLRKDAWFTMERISAEAIVAMYGVGSDGGSNRMIGLSEVLK